MGSVLFKGGGGGGTYSSDLSTKASDVVKGKSYVGSDTNDEIGTGTLDLSATANATAAQVLKDRKFFTNNNQLPNKPLVGTMANVAGLENAKTTRVANNNLILGMTNGAHITNSSGRSYPEVQTPYSTVASNLGLTAAKLANGTTVAGVKGTYKGLGNAVQANVLAGKTFSTASLSGVTGTMPNRGAYQYAGGFGSGTDNKGEYVAFNNMPVGYYSEDSSNSSWAPEVRMLKKDFLNYVGITADKIAYGSSIMGIAGTNRGGTQIKSNSPFADGKFESGAGIGNYNAYTEFPWYGTYGNDSVSLESGDHLHVTFKNYQADTDSSANNEHRLTYNKLINFSGINYITTTFMLVINPDDGYGRSFWQNTLYYDIGTTVGGNQLGTSPQFKSSIAIGSTTVLGTMKAGEVYAFTYDVRNITANGYLTLRYHSGGSNWIYSPYFNIYAITFT